MTSAPDDGRDAEGEALSLLGLALRAGGAATGIRASRDAVRSGVAHLVLTAGDASDTQLEKVLGPVRERGVPHRVVADRRTLGSALGSSSISAVAVTNPSLAERILEQLPAPG